MRRKAFVAAPAALALSFVACSLVENVDDYSSGPTDAGVDTNATSDARDANEAAPVDSGVDATDSTLADAADSTSVDTADSASADSVASDSLAADSAVDALTDSIAADADAAQLDGGTDTGVDAGAPYRHTVNIDGANDFTAASEKFSTTSTSYDAYVTWDANALYVGYVGADIGPLATSSKWVLVYLDVDPGAATGASKTDLYGTQQQVLPTGFGAEAYFAMKSDGSFSQFKKYASSAWSAVASPGVSFARTAGSSYVELRIPFSALGATTPAKLGVVTFMLNELSGAEGTYAGLWNASFTDGYSGMGAPKTILSYLQADLASPLAPATLSNRKP